MITCTFCKVSVASVDEAIDSGWHPSFWDHAGIVEYSDPVCPACAAEHMMVIDDELSLKDDSLVMSDDPVIVLSGSLTER